jgi:peptidyl-prolyl cis-trans isomerase B (cyclophilin B)
MTSSDSQQLLDKYQTLKTSIRNQGGFAAGDKETTRKLRDSMSTWNATHEDFQVIAAELQMSLWLEDADLCNSLFERLSELQPTNTRIALAWAEFLISQQELDSIIVYEELANRFPDSPEIIMLWARSLDAKNQFTKAISTVEKLNEDALASPATAEFYSSLLFADNRFEDSIAALDAINSSDLASDPLLLARINAVKSKSQDGFDKWKTELEIREVEETASDLPLVLMQTTKGPIELELFEDHAPNTVANFISLAETGYYDGILFHRVIDKFMAQGGDPSKRKNPEDASADDGPGYSIADEHTREDYRNHFAGSISMAKTSAPNSGGSQFFLTHLPTSHLDGKHTVFGRITSGLDTARSLEKDDEIIAVMVIRKRDHEYTPEKIGDETTTITPSRKPTLNSDTK